ncbi:DUF2752 domain-containing protein [Mucilaginibacter pankratovii]|uniref:DUF2752 domain-containing protein n=1 Tax=Mucilaginibacter pankratovii TaxID=2772110 RepID=UPI001CD18482|nr:DUF2752 domain-containing protein [Mucilaginibacter pankratovii]
MIKKLFNKYFELVFWITAMVCLAFNNPANHSHFSLCPFKAMGFTWCPGCGLGHSISWLFRGDIINSFHAHWLGIPAALGIFYRIYTLARPVNYLGKIENSHSEL